ncbi:hypothetical protein LVT70_01190 [Klebsiella pneumoniae]|nr:hypothetical protein [Klebsiella pneumoniae]
MALFGYSKKSLDDAYDLGHSAGVFEGEMKALEDRIKKQKETIKSKIPSTLTFTFTVPTKRTYKYQGQTFDCTSKYSADLNELFGKHTDEVVDMWNNYEGDLTLKQLQRKMSEFTKKLLKEGEE